MKLLYKIFANRFTTSLCLAVSGLAGTAAIAFLFALTTGELTWDAFAFMFTLFTLWFAAPIYVAAVINLIPVFKDPDYWWYLGVYYGGMAIAVCGRKYLNWADLDALIAGALGAPAICQMVWVGMKAQEKKRADDLRRIGLERENEELKKRIADLTHGQKS